MVVEFKTWWCYANTVYCHHYQLCWRWWWQFLTHSQVQYGLLSCRRQCRLAHLKAPPVSQHQSQNPSITNSVRTQGSRNEAQGVIVYVFVFVLYVCVWVYFNTQAFTEPLGSWLAQCVWDGCILLITMLLYFSSHYAASYSITSQPLCSDRS